MTLIALNTFLLFFLPVYCLAVKGCRSVSCVASKLSLSATVLKMYRHDYAFSRLHYKTLNQRSLLYLVTITQAAIGGFYRCYQVWYNNDCGCGSFQRLVIGSHVYCRRLKKPTCWYFTAWVLLDVITSPGQNLCIAFISQHGFSSSWKWCRMLHIAIIG